MRKKRDTVLATPQLRVLLGANPFVEQVEVEGVLLKDESYCQVACDLKDLGKLKQFLCSVTSLSDTDILFVAEESITYLNIQSADNLIEWAATFHRGTRADPFLHLQQISEY